MMVTHMVLLGTLEFYQHVVLHVSKFSDLFNNLDICVHCTHMLSKPYCLSCKKNKVLILLSRLGTTKFGETNVDTKEMHVDNHKPTFLSNYGFFINRSIDVADNARLA